MQALSRKGRGEKMLSLSRKGRGKSRRGHAMRPVDCDVRFHAFASFQPAAGELAQPELMVVNVVVMRKRRGGLPGVDDRWHADRTIGKVRGVLTLPNGLLGGDVFEYSNVFVESEMMS